MILGYDYFTCQFDTPQSQSGSGYNKIEIKNGIFDELQAMNTADLPFSIDKGEWGYNYVLKCAFQGNLNGGTIEKTVDSIIFQKREKNSFEWIDIASMNYDSAIQLYTVLDRYIQNGTTYEYAFVPVSSAIKGTRTIEEITPIYDGIWLTDKTHNYQLYGNVDESAMEHIGDNAVLKPIGSKYPITIYTDIDYRKSTIKANVSSSDFLDNGTRNIYVERNTRENFVKFLKNHQPKILRNTAGSADMMIIDIINNPEISPNNDMKYMAEVTFDYIECDDYTQEGLLNNNLI